jgi:hypothetical protein
MEGRVVDYQGVQDLQGIFFNENTFFNFVQDIEDNYYLLLTERDEENIQNTQYSYLLNIQLTEYIPKSFPPPIL